MLVSGGGNLQKNLDPSKFQQFGPHCILITVDGRNPAAYLTVQLRVGTLQIIVSSLDPALGRAVRKM